MSARPSEPPLQSWLADRMRELLAEKYGTGRVPGVRRISADIRDANDGATVSHGHIHNILTGEADNLTDRTRNLLARFFGKSPSCFHAPDERPADSLDADLGSVQALAARFATFDPAQVDAIKQAIEIVTAQDKKNRRG